MSPKKHSLRDVLALAQASSPFSQISRPHKARRVADDVVTIDPAFCLSDYASSQPYKDPATLDQLINVLREAGLPD